MTSSHSSNSLEELNLLVPAFLIQIQVQANLDKTGGCAMVDFTCLAIVFIQREHSHSTSVFVQVVCQHLYLPKQVCCYCKC